MTEKEKLFDLCSTKGHCPLSPEVFEQCATFLFYTSWYEERLFNKDNEHRWDTDEKICKDLFNDYHIDLTKYDGFGQYFSNRYVKPTGGRTDNFRNLRLHPASANTVFNCIKSFNQHRSRSEKLLWSYLQIAYRFRNNMFHGSKGLVHLPTYINEFKEINSFMHQLISDILDSGYKGFNT